LIQQTEQAFSDKQMEHVQQLYRQGQRTYGDKDVILDDLLARLAELNEMTHQYEEYLHSTADTVRQVRDMIEKDAAAAGELLAQLDGYPEMVLESFPDLHDLRDKVNHRLEADHAYTRLYHLLFATEQAEVQQAVEMAGHAVTTYDDDRFSALTQALQHHLDFLKGQQEQAAGQTVRALEHLKAVAAADNHPDQEAAIKLIAALSDTSND
jgi:predicted ester cyclase